MGKLTFVIEFEDGKEPPVYAHMEALGGKVVAVAFRDTLSEGNPTQTITTHPQVLSEMRCFVCSGKHPMTLYTILCKCLFSEVTVQAVTELDNKAAHCHTPVPQRHRPFL